VDLNFGCPAKVVNRHGGGAALLDEPELMHRILREVCRTVPAGTVVSAKMRLGTQDDARAVECAQALAEGGAMELVVHGRTKLQGYRPPAYWDRIGAIREAVAVPVVANGEIWTVDDARRCQAESGCTDLMLGRGMVCDPGLALAVRAAVAGEGGGAGRAGLGRPAAAAGGLLGPGAAAHRPAPPGRPAQAVAQSAAPPPPRGRGGLPGLARRDRRPPHRAGAAGPGRRRPGRRGAHGGGPVHCRVAPVRRSFRPNAFPAPCPCLPGPGDLGVRTQERCADRPGAATQDA
jgi:tRNA-dihydrouridine synthase C